jgi:DNA/RNA endonuclease G (NUC1)
MFPLIFQWISINRGGGNWNNLENKVRKLAKTKDLHITIGVLGILKLDGKEIYLDRHNPLNKRLPVPERFYKIVHNKTDDTREVYVISNNPFADKKELEAEMRETFGDSAKTFDDNVQKGYTFTVPYDDFIKTVDTKFEGEVTAKHEIPLTGEGKAINVVQHPTLLHVLQVKYDMDKTEGQTKGCSRCR